MNNSVENIKKSKQLILELMITTVIISMGINFIVMGISNELNNSNTMLIIIGIALIVLSLLAVFMSRFKQSNLKKAIEAVLVYDNNDRQLLDIKNYDFSNDVCRYLKAAMAEEKNIESMWLKEKLGMTHVFNNVKPNQTYIGVSRSAALLNQLLEYIILKKLSTLTTDYFNLPHYKKAKIRKIQRNEISEFVASNVFVNLFSKPTYERSAFDNKELKNDVVFCYGKNGEIYDKFELYVPLKCQFSREKPNTIVFTHPYFKLKITPAFTGFGEVLPVGFEKEYMKVLDIKNVTCFKILIGIELKFSCLAFFMNKSQYYGWIDKFINDLTEYASINRFFERIQWDLIRTILNCK